MYIYVCVYTFLKLLYQKKKKNSNLEESIIKRFSPYGWKLAELEKSLETKEELLKANVRNLSKLGGILRFALKLQQSTGMWNDSSQSKLPDETEVSIFLNYYSVLYHLYLPRELVKKGNFSIYTYVYLCCFVHRQFEKQEIGLPKFSPMHLAIQENR